MHYIQKHILDELRRSSGLRYSQLNTQDVESGHFRYHLNQLVKAGFIVQVSRGVYELSHEGQQFVDTLSENSVNPAAMPKVITYSLLRDGGTVFLHKKRKQPYADLLNMIGGKLHFGETAHEAALREIYEKTGNHLQNLTPSGTCEIMISAHGSLLTHVIAITFIADVDADTLITDQLEAIDIAKLPQHTDLAPDFMAVVESMTAAEPRQTIYVSL